MTDGSADRASCAVFLRERGSDVLFCARLEALVGSRGDDRATAASDPSKERLQRSLCIVVCVPTKSMFLRVVMSYSVELIVDGYVKLNDRSELEALLAHRKGLLTQLHGVTGVDPKQAFGQVSQEIARDRTRACSARPQPSVTRASALARMLAARR